MPADGLWTIRLAVTRRRPEDANGARVVLGSVGDDGTASNNNNNASLASSSGEGFDHDPTDWVSVQMGPALTSLIEVTSVKNMVNDDLGEVSQAGNTCKTSSRGEGGGTLSVVSHDCGCTVVVTSTGIAFLRHREGERLIFIEADCRVRRIRLYCFVVDHHLARKKERGTRLQGKRQHIVGVIAWGNGG